MLPQTAHLIEIAVNLEKLKFNETGRYSELLSDFRLPDSLPLSGEKLSQLPSLDQEVTPYELCIRLQTHCNFLGLYEYSNNVSVMERRLRQAEATFKKFREYMAPDSNRLLTYDGANAEIERLTEAVNASNRS